MIRTYHLGLPVWGIKEWTGHLYRRGSRPGEYLGQYAEAWNAVEGNSTFYSPPPPDTVEKWRDATPESFRFCFKLPREITHEHRLEGADGLLAAFLERMAPLGPRRGPLMIQMPPSFGPDRLDILDRFLHRLPPDLHFGVELRHPGFYPPHDTARTVDALLVEHGVERILMETRALRSGDASHPDVVRARRKKPDLPVAPIALGPHPLVRLITHPDRGVNRPHLERWAHVVARWIGEGRRPYVFIHCPNDFHSAWIAEELHGLLRAHRPEVGELPPWPGRSEPPEPVQLSLL